MESFFTRQQGGLVTPASFPINIIIIILGTPIKYHLGKIFYGTMFTFQK
ncbi:hypothetical protein (plasmid) [Metabacillus dongyingensis]|nr:hypothetical protein [Metabacillus dongyingensis]